MPCVARWQCLGETVRAPRYLGPQFVVLRTRRLEMNRQLCSPIDFFNRQ